MKIKNSCFTKPIVKTLVNVYNAQADSENKISLNQPEESLLQQLSQKMKAQCAQNTNQEYCMAKELNQEQIIKDSFMPFRKWKKPNEWLSNIDIDNVMSVFEKAYPHFKYCGTLTIDFAEKDKYGKCLSDYFCNYMVAFEKLKLYTHWGAIFNLDRHEQSGSHWVSLFINYQHSPPFAFYFDSATTFGSKIPDSIYRLMKTIQSKTPNMKLMYNTKQHQRSNTECGVYSLFFIITILTQQIPFLSNLPMSMPQIINLFLKGTIPDSFIEQYRKIFFTVASS